MDLVLSEPILQEGSKFCHHDPVPMEALAQPVVAEAEGAEEEVAAAEEAAEAEEEEEVVVVEAVVVEEAVAL